MSNNLLNNLLCFSLIGLIHASKDACLLVTVPSCGFLSLRSFIVLNFLVDSYTIIQSWKDAYKKFSTAAHDDYL